MRLPRVRLTVRTMMALVAHAAVLLAGIPLVAERVRVSLRYREMAAYCSKAEATYRSYERRYLTELQLEPAGGQSFGGSRPPRSNIRSVWESGPPGASAASKSAGSRARSCFSRLSRI
jgi:hypothetical protein